MSTLTDADIDRAAQRLGVEPAVVLAVTRVEARGSGFLPGSERRPKILFEGHWFHRLTDGRFSAAHPTISYPKWTKAHYLGGAREYERLIAAIRLDVTAALKSASWGLFQIMGFNHQAAGFSDVRSYVNAQAMSEGAQLDAFAGFVLANPAMAEALRDKAWAEFARRYNGPGYKANAYDSKLAAAFASYRDRLDSGVQVLPSAATRALQAALNVHGAGIDVDGWSGPKTEAAISRFQKASGLEVTGHVDEATRRALGLEGD